MSIDTDRPAWIITPDTYRHDHRRFLREYRKALRGGNFSKWCRKHAGRIMWRVAKRRAEAAA